MSLYQNYIHPHKKARMTFLGWWIVSLIIWSFMMNISLVIVIMFSILGYFIICKPLAALFHIFKSFININFFNKLDIFEAYYCGYEFGRIVRAVVKTIFFIIVMLIAKIFMQSYLIFIN